MFGLFRRQVVRGQRSLSEAGLDPHFSLKLSSVLCRKKSTVKLRVKGLGLNQSHSRSANADGLLAMIRLSLACFWKRDFKIDILKTKGEGVASRHCEMTRIMA